MMSDEPMTNLCSEGSRAGVSVSGPAAASATNLPAGPTPAAAAAAAGDPSLPPLPPAWRKLLLEGYQVVNENPVRSLLCSRALSALTCTRCTATSTSLCVMLLCIRFPPIIDYFSNVFCDIRVHINII